VHPGNYTLEGVAVVGPGIGAEDCGLLPAAVGTHAGVVSVKHSFFDLSVENLVRDWSRTLEPSTLWTGDAATPAAGGDTGCPESEPSTGVGCVAKIAAW
jgi:hypothetical protein